MRTFVQDFEQNYTTVLVDEFDSRTMTAEEREAMSRAFWKSVEVIDEGIPLFPNFGIM